MQQILSIIGQSSPRSGSGADWILGSTGIALAKLPQVIPQIDQTLANIFVGVICLTLVIRSGLAVAEFVAERRDKHRSRRKRRERGEDDN